MSTNQQNSNVKEIKNEPKTNETDDNMKVDLPANKNTVTTTTNNNNNTSTNPPSESIKKENDNKPKGENNTNNNPSDIKPPKKRRKKRNQESGPLSAMKNELLIATRNKISFDPTKKVRKWVRQPITFGTLGSTFNTSIWHSNEPRQLHLDKLLNKPAATTATTTEKTATTTTAAAKATTTASTTASNTKPNAAPIASTPPVVPSTASASSMTNAPVVKS